MPFSLGREAQPVQQILRVALEAWAEGYLPARLQGLMLRRVPEPVIQRRVPEVAFPVAEEVSQLGVPAVFSQAGHTPIYPDWGY